MQTINFWHQQYLHWQKVAQITFFVFFSCILCSPKAQAQWIKRGGNNSGQYTEDVSGALRKNKRRLTRPINFGFYLAGLSSWTGRKFEDAFAQQANTALVTVNSKASPGFGVGFYSSFRLSEFWDFRTHMQASFYERQLEYNFADGSQEVKIIESSSFEIPILFKYRAQLRGIKGMYLIAGVKPGFSLSQKSEDDENVQLKGTNLSLEYGFGMDAFFPYFKFAPEVRFSHGLLNVLDKSEDNPFNRSLQRLNTHTVTIFFHFGS